MVVDKLKEGVDIVFGKFPGYKDQLYICYYHIQGNSPYLLQYTDFKNDDFCINGSLNYPRFQPERLATEQEQEWFLACIKAKQLVKKPPLKLIHELWY